jgi:hypothetical protein
VIEWISGVTIISDGEYKTVLPSYIDLKKAEGVFQLSFVGDINNLIVVNINKKEGEILSGLLKEIVKND